MTSEVFINKDFTVSVSGHRELYTDFDRAKLKEVFIKLIESGVDTFLIGMALGFDTECFHILEELKSDYNLRIIACIPCQTQSYKFSVKQKREYERMLNLADEKVYVSREYTPYCMMKRNRFMVDNSRVLVCYLRKASGGTFNTYKYAKNKDLPIIKL